MEKQKDGYRYEQTTQHGHYVEYLETDEVKGEQRLADTAYTMISVPVNYKQTEARKMLTLVNNFRTGNDTWVWNENNSEKIYYSGLGLLTYDYALEKVAMRRAAEIAIRYDHVRPNGERCFTAFDEEGYTIIAARAENIAVWYSTPESAFNAFREDDVGYLYQGHRRAMLNPNYTAVGFAHVVYNGNHYWAQHFSSKVMSSLPVAACDGAKEVQIQVNNSQVLNAVISVEESTLEVAKGETVAYPKVNVKITMPDTWPGAGPSQLLSRDCYRLDSNFFSQNGQSITALKTGTTSIAVEAFGKSITIPVTITGAVKKPVITELKNVVDGVAVTWTKSAGAEGYYVYRKLSGGKYEKLAQVKGADILNYVDDTAVSGNRYYYLVKAYGKGEVSDYDSGSGILCVGVPTVSGLERVSTGVRIKWTGVEGATKYYVYRKVADGSYEKLSTVLSTQTRSYIDQTAKAGTTYYYVVRAVADKTLGAMQKHKFEEPPQAVTKTTAATTG